MNKDPQQVEVYVSISGDYCAFHEMSFNVIYDLTNNILLEDPSFDVDEDDEEDNSPVDSNGYSENYKKKVKDYLESYVHEGGDYTDYETRNAILFNGNYYVEW